MCHDDKREKIMNRRNRTINLRKDTWRKRKIQLLKNIGSIPHQIDMEKKIKKSTSEEQ